MRCLVALLVASLFVDKDDFEFSSIPRHNLYPDASYLNRVCSQKYSPLTPRTRAHVVRVVLIGGGGNIVVASLEVIELHLEEERQWLRLRL
ncbi:hypothetical protein JHK85_022631 [Glycine max]|uniref:Uncharacterized protein n=1 Tax=Glycine max TaxID=3847 RepID=K7L892_SOYBN|nr:hypothetical protein JHK87_022076 [Glycine soja]KAG5016495.1 hypothetical protein JHK85_022631 [Glycine max]KAH1052644.1 hypothetical protein GYH30_022117 [Glycine max]